MKSKYLILGLGASFVALSSVWAKSTNDIINDQIADHFNQVFSDQSNGYAPAESSWVPGIDKDTQVLGSVWTLDVAATVVSEVDIENRKNHEVGVRYLEYGVGAKIPLKPRHKLSLAFHGVNYEIDETVTHGMNLIGLDQAERIDTGFMYKYSINPRWELLGGGGFIQSSSNNEMLGGKNTFLGYAGASYMFKPNLTMAFAIPFSSRDLDGEGPFPVFVMDWRINDRNHLHLGDYLSYEYALKNDWRNVFGVTFDSANITLHMDGREFLGEFRKNPYYLINDYTASITYRHTFDKGVIFYTRLGVHIGEHSTWDREDKLESISLDPGVGMSVGLKYRF